MLVSIIIIFKMFSILNNIFDKFIFRYEYLDEEIRTMQKTIRTKTKKVRRRFRKLQKTVKRKN